MIIDFGDGQSCRNPIIAPLNIRESGLYTIKVDPTKQDGYNPVYVDVWDIRNKLKYWPKNVPFNINVNRLDTLKDDLWITGNYSQDYHDQAAPDMTGAFNGDYDLIYAPPFDYTQTTNMASCFYDCSNLYSAEISGDTTGIQDMTSCFEECISLVYGPRVLNIENCYSTNSLFYDCNELLYAPNITTSTVLTDTSYMFGSCSSLTTIPLFETGDVTDMIMMFEGCDKLTSVPLFDTSSVQDMNCMFDCCSSLTSVPLFDTSSVQNMNCMFDSCSSLTSVPRFDTSLVEDMGYMFGWCSSLTTIPYLDATNVRNADGMLDGCINCAEIEGLGLLKVSLDLSGCGRIRRDSVMNVINELGQKDPTFDPNPTLTLQQNVYNQLTPEDIARATNKGWTIAQVA